jgi:microcystin degradation protein MlrC
MRSVRGIAKGRLAVAAAVLLVSCGGGATAETSDTESLCDAARQASLSGGNVMDIKTQLGAAAADHPKADAKLLEGVALMQDAVISRSAFKFTVWNRAQTLIAGVCGPTATLPTVDPDDYERKRVPAGGDAAERVS